MGKKGGAQQKVNTKTEKKKQEKLIEDKTFGLKNKNKSKSVQKYIKGVTLQVKGNPKGGEAALIQKELEAKAQKRKDLEKQQLLASLFKGVSNIKQQEAGSGEDPKSILCAFFKAGVCKKGKKCKFSHNLDIEKKSAKIDLYSDARDKEGMENWDQDYLEKVIEEKAKRKGPPPSNITCKFFIDAVEKKIYGWLWECPNGEACQYRHALPAGYMLKADKEKALKQEEDQIPLEERIEEMRAALPVEGLTPVTLETFTLWKKKKEAEKEKKIEEKRKAEAKKTGTKGYNILTGRALFKYDPNAFQTDDADAYEEYEEEKEEKEEVKEVEQKSVSSKEWTEKKRKNTEEEIKEYKLKEEVEKEEEKEENKVEEEGVEIDKDVFLAEEENLDDLEDIVD